MCYTKVLVGGRMQCLVDSLFHDLSMNMLPYGHNVIAATLHVLETYGCSLIVVKQRSNDRESPPHAITEVLYWLERQQVAW
jgi:hypothetical protein